MSGHASYSDTRLAASASVFAIKAFAAATADHDIRAEFFAKAKS